MDTFIIVITWQVWVSAIAISVIFFIGYRLKKPPTAGVPDEKVFSIEQRVLNSKPEDPDDVYEGYALYCTNKDMYLQCIDSSTYDWIDTLKHNEDFLLNVDGEPRPSASFYRAMATFIGSLHCVLVPCKLYKKNFVRTKLFFKDKTYRGRFTEPDFTKSMDFHVYYERRIEEETVCLGNKVSSNINTPMTTVAASAASVASTKKLGPPNPRPPAPPRPRILNH